VYLKIIDLIPEEYEVPKEKTTTTTTTTIIIESGFK